MRIAIIGAGTFQKPLIQKARDLKIETHVFAWEKGAEGKDIADFFYPISIIEKEQILEIAKAKKINGVVSIASEIATPTVSFIAEQLRLPGNSVQSSSATLNKALMKKKFIENNIPCAQGWRIDKIDKEFLVQLDYSKGIIIKPVDRSGSLAVELVYEIKSAERAVEKALAESFTHACMVEEFIEGPEYSVETISYQGRHEIVAITEKETTGKPYFVEVSHFQPAFLSTEVHEKMKSLIPQVLSSLEITNGISHVELKISGSDIKIIEVGGRMGGDYIGSHLVQLSSGVDLLQVAIEISLGTFDWPHYQAQPAKPAGIVFLCTPKPQDSTVFEKNKISLSQKVVFENISCKVNDKVKKTASSCTRYGCVIYRGDKVSPAQLEAHFGVELK